MKIRRIDHVGVVVNDLSAAKAFFLDLGLEVQGEGELLDQVTGLNDVKTAVFVELFPYWLDLPIRLESLSPRLET